MVKACRFVGLVLALLCIAPASAQDATPVLPDPPTPMTLPAGSPAEQAVAFADALDLTPDNLAAWLGLYDALAIPVIGQDGLPVGSTPADDPVGPPFWMLWYETGLSTPGHGIPLSDAGRLLALGLEDDPSVEANAALGAELSPELLRGLRLAAKGSDPQARLLGYFVRERILRGNGVDVLVPETTPEQAVIDPATFDLLRWAILRSTLLELGSTATTQRILPKVAAPALPALMALQDGSSPCSALFGDEDATYWTNWVINKVGGGFQLPGMTQAFSGVIDRVAEKLNVSQTTAGRISKAVSWGNAVTSALSLAMQLSALDVGFSFEPEKLVRTRNTSPGKTLTIHVALSSNPENLPDGNQRAACFASFALNALGVGFSFPSGGRIAGAEVLFEGGQNFPEKVLFGNYQQIRQDTDANGEVQLDVIGVAQKKDLPDSAQATDEEFSVVISAQPEAATGNTIANIFFGGLTFGVAPTGGGAAGSAIDILKTFRFSLGEYFFPMVDWKFPGFRASGQSDQMTFSGTICDLTKPFILDGVIGSYNYTFEYFPSNQGQQGAMTYEGGSGDLIGSGSGVYEVKNLNSGSPTLEVNTMGCLTIMGTLNSCKPTQDTITLTPLETDECGSE